MFPFFVFSLHSIFSFSLGSSSARCIDDDDTRYITDDDDDDYTRCIDALTMMLIMIRFFSIKSIDDDP